MDGSKVWDAYQEGQIEAIRNYCETDALNTYLLFVRWEQLRGHLTAAQWRKECDFVRNALRSDDLPHLNEFLENWQPD